MGEHQQRFENKQTHLRRLLSEFEALGCKGGIPSDSWDWATMEAPELKDTDIAKGWIAMHRTVKGSDAQNANFWAYMALDDLRDNNLERYWETINEIRRLDDSDSMLSNLAAGPLEDLLASSGSVFIDRCEILAKVDDRFKVMLGIVWKNSIPDDIWERVRCASSWK